MKKTLMFIILCALLVVPSALAVTLPTREETLYLNLTYYNSIPSNFIGIEALGGRYLAVAYRDSPSLSTSYIQIFSATSGSNTDGDSIYTLDIPYPSGISDIDYHEDYIAVSRYYLSPLHRGIDIIDVNNKGFINVSSTCSDWSQNVYSGFGEIMFLSNRIFYVERSNQIVRSFNGTCEIRGSFGCEVVAVLKDAELAVCSNGNVMDYSDIDNPVFSYSISGWTGNDIISYNNDDQNPIMITDEGKLVVLNEANGQLIQSSVISPLDVPLIAYSRDNIIGEYNYTLAVWNSTDLFNTDVSVTSFAITSQDVFANDASGNFFQFDMTTGKLDYYTTEVGLPVIDDDVNTPPDYAVEWLGVDAGDNLVFAISMFDEEGGRVYSAIDVDKYPDELDVNTITNSFDFTSASDLDRVDIFDAGVLSIVGVSDSPFSDVNPFTPQAMLVNYSAGGLSSWDFDLVDITASDSNELSFSTSFVIEPEGFDSNTDYWVALSDKNGVTFWAMKMNLSFSNLGNFDGAQFEVINENNGYDLVADLANWDTGYVLVVEVTLDVDAQTITTRLANQYSGTFYEGTEPLTNGLPVISSIGEFNSLTAYDIMYYYYDYFDTSYSNELDTPEYNFFDTLSAGGSRTKAYREEARGYGIYEVVLYGTDEELGLSYFENPFELSINYDDDTVVLSDDEIDELIDEVQDEWEGQTSSGDTGIDIIRVEGDFITAKLADFLDAIGIKTTASKIVIGLLIVIALVMATASWSSGRGDAMFFVGTLATLGMAYIGLFPIWFMLVIVLVSVAIWAKMGRDTITGGGGG